MGDRFVIGPYGEKGTVPEEQVPAVEAAGGRALTAREKTEVEAQQAYEQSSTAQKIGGAVSPLVGPIASSALSATGVTAVRPETQAFESGMSSGLTMGFDEAAVHEAIRQTAGQEAADEYAKHLADAKELYPGAHIGGAVLGTAAASIGMPASRGISGAGALAEQGVGRLVGGLAERGVAGRIAATTAKWGARGAVEGALYGAANETSDALVQDHELGGEKLWAATGSGGLAGLVAGGALGGAGAAVRAGLGAAAEGTSSVISRVLAKADSVAGKAEEASADAVSGAKEAVAAAKADTAAAVQKEAADALTSLAKAADETGAKSIVERLKGQATDQKLREIAFDRAWRATGGRKAYVAQAEKYLPALEEGGVAGTDAIGETLLRHGVIDNKGQLLDAAFKAGEKGTPEILAERIAGPKSTVGQKLGDIIDNSGGQVNGGALLDAVDAVLVPLTKKAGFGDIARSVESYGTDLIRKLGIHVPDDIPAVVAERLGPKATGAEIQAAIADEVRAAIESQNVSVQKLMEQRQALDDLVYREGSPLNPSPRIQEMRALRGKVEGVLMDALDESSGRVPGELKAEYRTLKRDYTALSIAQKAAEDAATRGTANRTFSLTDKIVGTGVGASAQMLGIPGFIAGPAAAALSKVVRERGDAAAAVLLSRAADMGLVAKAMGTVDEAIGKAAKGLVSPPAPRPLPTPTPKEPIIPRAQTAMMRVAQAQSNATAFASRVMAQTEGLAQTAPRIAAQYAAQSSLALSFLSSKMPVTSDPDPLDPHPAPKPTEAQAAEFMRYVEYVDRPMKFFEDLQHGKITYEGAEVAQALMPRAFAQLQAQTQANMADELARGVRIPFEQRQKLSMLLQVPLDVSMRTDHATLLQGNVQSPPGDAKLDPNAPAAPGRPLSFQTQPSALDRLSER